MSGKQKTKKIFRVDDFGSVAACLDQMAKEKYQPVRRIEKPVFREGPSGPEPVEQEIEFEGHLEENNS